MKLFDSHCHYTYPITSWFVSQRMSCHCPNFHREPQHMNSLSRLIFEKTKIRLYFFLLCRLCMFLTDFHMLVSIHTTSYLIIFPFTLLFASIMSKFICSQVLALSVVSPAPVQISSLVGALLLPAFPTFRFPFPAFFSFHQSQFAGQGYFLPQYLSR